MEVVLFKNFKRSLFFVCLLIYILYKMHVQNFNLIGSRTTHEYLEIFIEQVYKKMHINMNRFLQRVFFTYFKKYTKYCF